MDRLALGENDRELEKLKRNWRFANKGPLSSSSSFFFFFFFWRILFEENGRSLLGYRNEKDRNFFQTSMEEIFFNLFKILPSVYKYLKNATHFKFSS
jgi:hypothetical protein